MKLAIMQPYIFPYVGYFQLISAVDAFVVYDNIQYTKKGWINRNRILVNGKDEFITLPLKKASDYLDVVQRELSDSFNNDKDKILRKIYNSYLKAPYFKETFSLVQEILNYNDKNLFGFIFNSIKTISHYLNISTEFIVSSSIDIDVNLKSQDKVMAICKALQASHYINPIGGTELYSKDFFMAHNVKLSFLKSKNFEYKQFQNQFIPWLSIIDVLMFNEKDQVIKVINTEFTIE